MKRLKPDAELIRAHLASLPSRHGLGGDRVWWINNLFRFDDVEAAAKILNGGRLLSRSLATEQGAMLRDSANPEVVGNTSHEWKSCARLYFRPKTPTLHNGEGFRPPEQLSGGNWPVPVVLIFHSPDILAQEGVRFSDGSLAARRVKTGFDARFLRSIPFEKVYHVGGFTRSERDEIIFHRQAEVAVPGHCDLSSLKHIICRSEAEYTTLLSLLTPEALLQWHRMIGLGEGERRNVFFRRWSYVDRVELGATEMAFRFNPSTEAPGPFKMRVVIVTNANQKLFWEGSWMANTELRVTLPGSAGSTGYKVSLRLSGDLAYRGQFLGRGTSV